jgi:hypothetical protein
MRRKRASGSRSISSSEPSDDRAERSDKLADAVDYDALYQTVREVVEGKSFHLLEALAAADRGAHPRALSRASRAGADLQAEPGMDHRRGAR